MPYVYSTLSSSVDYTTYVKNSPNDVSTVEHVVSIAGGANVAGKGAALITPRGVATKVTDEQVTALRENQVFKLHEANGYITVNDKKEDPENVATDLTTRDESSPIVPEDLEAEGLIVTDDGAKLPTADDTPKRSSRRA